MYIEKINDDKIKVTVNKEDVKIWNVDIKNLTENTSEAQDLFWFALRQAEKDVNFCVGKSQLLVEAIPTKSDGFIMFISKVSKEQNVMDIIEKGAIHHHQTEIKVKKRSRSANLINIFKFGDFEDLCHCVSQIEETFCGKSALYKYDGGFYLVLSPYDTMMFFETENVIMEYAQRVSFPVLYEGILKEHGEMMIEENALEIIGSYFK